MNRPTDQQLLRDYAGRRSEPAFAELVQRHVDLVYSAALRMLRDAHLAEDVTQGVFLALAQNAPQLADHPVLSGWLHRTAQNHAAKIVRTDVRRRAREQEAAAMTEMLPAESDIHWEQIAPYLDAALGELNEQERDALLLRYFERKSAREMAETLGVSDEAAQKRVSRAVERMRELFAKRGVTVGAGGLTAVLTANAVQAAPAGMVTAISSAAALAGTTVTASTITTATKVITMTMIQKAVVAAALVIAAGAGIYQARQTSLLRDQVQSLQQQQAPLADQIKQLQQERDNATNRLANLQDEIARTKNSNLELLKLRSENTKLYQDSKELAQIKANKGETGASNSFISLAMSESKAEMTNAALKKLAGIKTQLGLTADQEGQIRNILIGDIDARVQVLMGVLTGGQSVAEQKNQEKNMLADEEAQIATVLSPDQQTSYEQMKKDQQATWAMNYAKSEASAMNQYLNLSPEQSQAVVSILASLPAGQGGRGNAQDADAKAQLEIRLQALAQTLTPDQLQSYRREKLIQIEQATMGIQMMKSLVK